MPRNPRALLFDLDDTLYPLRRFRLSGFAAVSRHVARFHGADQRQAFKLLVAASRGPRRGKELDLLIAQFGLKSPVTELVRIVRGHDPVLRIPPATQQTLRLLGRSWQLAVVTNGIPAIQAAKVRALGLDRLVDAVVYASDYGSGEGKPDREPFLEALRRLDVTPAQAIAVGDDEFADIFGATRCGLRTIQTREWRNGPLGAVSICADAVVNHISEVPAMADCILPRKLASHAA